VSGYASAQELWDYLRNRIEEWERVDPEAAAKAIPSVPSLAGRNWEGWLTTRIAEGTPLIGWAAALAVLDWANRETTSDSSTAAGFFSAMHERLQRDASHTNIGRTTPDLQSALIWALCSTATEDTLPTAARAIASAFEHAKGLQDAAALRGGRIFVKRWREPALRALIAAFGGGESPTFVRFSALLASGK